MEVVRNHASRFFHLTEELRKKGIRKKEIANYLEMPPPVFSSLSKTVIPKIIQIDSTASTEEKEIHLNKAFELVNNLSQVKIISKLGTYVEKLEKFEVLNKEPFETYPYFSRLKKHVDNSYKTIKQHYEGIYDLYYLSSDKYCIKKDTFMIKCNSADRIAEVFKGNKNTSVRYNGIAVINNAHTLSLQLTETDENPEEYLMIHLSLPFIRKTTFLRGIFSCINFSRQPIARKVVLVRRSDDLSWENYEKLMPHYFLNPDELEHPEIVKYLLDKNAMIECKAITNPTFELTDLVKEINIKSND